MSEIEGDVERVEGMLGILDAAETYGKFYRRIVAEGVTEEHALVMTCELIHVIMGPMASGPRDQAAELRRMG